MRTTTRLELRPIEQLIPYANNARTHSEDQIQKLRRSLREFGFVAPVLIDSAGNILAGHGRVLAARAEGLTEAPCVLVEHLSPEQQRAYILADSRLAEDANWNEELLAAELAALMDAGFDVTIAGFEPEPIFNPKEVVDDDFEPALPDVPICKGGQAWQLGEHRLVCGDATSPESYMRLMDQDLASLLFTDPPYMVDYTGGTKNALKIQNDDLDEESAIKFLRCAFECSAACLTKGAAFYIFGGDAAPGYAFRVAAHAAKLRVRQTLVWVKNQAVLSRQDYHWQHESAMAGSVGEDADYMIYGWRDGAAHTWLSDRKQTTALFFDKPLRSDQHPTMKPVRLCAYLIENSCPKSKIVLDPFAGSGSTLIACEQTGRIARCMEIDPKYCDVIISRWEAFTGGKAVLLNE